jgi:chemotaxis methyl-accepting protein methylase
MVSVHCVPRTLTSELRQKRAELTGQLLRVLEQKQRVGFYEIVTGDESWFLRHSNHWERLCLSADEVRTSVRRTRAALKTMFTVFSSIQRAIFIDWLPPGKVQQQIIL